MSRGEYTVLFECPSAQEFSDLRAKVGWGETCLEMGAKSLAQSLFHVVIREGNKLIAMGRIVGDGVMYFYVQDVVVDPDYQKLGLGAVLMTHIEDYLAKTAQPGSTIGLLAAQGKEAFYQRYGYLLRPGNSFGHGMCKFISSKSKVT